MKSNSQLKLITFRESSEYAKLNYRNNFWLCKMSAGAWAANLSWQIYQIQRIVFRNLRNVLATFIWIWFVYYPNSGFRCWQRGSHFISDKTKRIHHKLQSNKIRILITNISGKFDTFQRPLLKHSPKKLNQFSIGIQIFKCFNTNTASPSRKSKLMLREWLGKHYKLESDFVLEGCRMFEFLSYFSCRVLRELCEILWLV